MELPDLGLIGNAWGLGWEIFDWEGAPVVGHDGGTIGQSAFLRIVPGTGVAVAILTNGGSPVSLYSALMTKILAEIAGVTMPALPVPPAAPVDVDLERILGTYSSSVSDSVVRQDEDGRIWLERTMKGIFAELGPAPAPFELVGWNGDSLVPALPERGMHMPHAFVGDDGSGRALYLHTGRADRRVDA